MCFSQKIGLEILKKTEEMKPLWWNFEEIPYEQMWEDDKIWLPRILGTTKSQFNFTFWFDENSSLEKWQENL